MLYHSSDCTIAGRQCFGVVCVCVFVCVYLSVRYVSSTLVAVHAMLVKVHS